MPAGGKIPENGVELRKTGYPRIRVRILDVSANEGLEAVARGEADFGIIDPARMLLAQAA